MKSLQNVQKGLRRSRAEWRLLVSEQEQSGLTQREFCEQHQIPLHSFRTRKHQLSKSSSMPVISDSQTDPHWLELPLVSRPDLSLSNASNRSEDPVAWDIELQLGNGLCLRLRQR